MPPPSTGKVQTVLGPVAPEAIGPTLTHEHLFIDFGVVFQPPAEASQLALAYAPVSLENLGWVRLHWNSNLDNLRLWDEETAIAEARRFQRAGGSCIVDATIVGLGRDPLALARVARATGLHIVMGTGYYVAAAHPSDMDARTEASLAEEMVRDITAGVGDTGVKAGIIGEIGCSWPLHPRERMVLRAAARAQRRTGASLLIHPGRAEEAPWEILQVLQEAGADLTRVVMGHLDRTVFHRSTLLRIAQTGCVLEWDLFGQETWHYPLNPAVDMPSDAQRLETIRWCVSQGLGERIVIAHDICTKHRLARYGGHGYGYILEHIVPTMRRRGFTEEQIETILVHTPRRLLTLAEPRE
ncbi:MAG: aryldialkylphosphatase [Dehalococcoidia bacterium]|nr:aryldialkylphosphatase [Dehalococcoidia bacterium]MDW8119735.1 aryldialkylphosphatase [Chloroflexota bacterium]